MPVLFIARTGTAEIPETSKASETSEAAETSKASRAISAVTISPGSRPAVSASIASPAAVSAGTFLHNLLICFLYLFEFLFRLYLIGIVDIGIRMVLSAQCPICFFNLLLGSIRRYTENLIRIHHRPVPAFSLDSLSPRTFSYRYQTPEYIILRRISIFSKIGSCSNSLEHSDIISTRIFLHCSSKSGFPYIFRNGLYLPFSKSFSTSS